MALDMKMLPVQCKPLHVPPLEEIADVLNKGLKKHFQDVKVEVVNCPDLTQMPFTLANKGLTGNTHMMDVGGPPYLIPVVQYDKVYDLCDIPDLVKMKSAFIIGAGAGPHPYATVNCEAIMNINIENSVVKQQTRIVKVNQTDGTPMQEQLPTTETRFALLGNFFICEGKPGQVLQVHVKKRVGRMDFIASIRNVLADHYGNRILGLGGTFLLKEGRAKQHVMPDFSKTAINSDDEINQWLNFYEMSAPLIANGTLITGDHGLDLRVQHFHSFSYHGEGGHYHIDTTPDTVEYLGYFNLAQDIYRVDKPEHTHNVGRD